MAGELVGLEDHIGYAAISRHIASAVFRLKCRVWLLGFGAFVEREGKPIRRNDGGARRGVIDQFFVGIDLHDAVNAAVTDCNGYIGLIGVGRHRLLWRITLTAAACLRVLFLAHRAGIDDIAGHADHAPHARYRNAIGRNRQPRIVKPRAVRVRQYCGKKRTASESTERATDCRADRPAERIAGDLSGDCQYLATH